MEATVRYARDVLFRQERALGYVFGVQLVRPEWRTYKALVPVVATEWPEDGEIEGELSGALRLISDNGRCPALKGTFAEGVVLGVLRVCPRKQNFEDVIIGYLAKQWPREEVVRVFDAVLKGLDATGLISVERYPQGRYLWRRNRPE